MGKLEAFSLPGCDCYFHSNDHGPPHFHVKRAGEWEVRVFFHEEPAWIEMKWPPGRRLRRSVRRELLGLVAEHREALWIEWSEKVQVNDE